ncbi:hypothetical protein BD410DRAFT_781349 [Rickenella mellea]|uniref:Exonuclease domain-containing protein n=1 Tax=Rickenella mellea TaxID=50990 RepID=A0A4Y7QN19_9AGAM|nr:hypothetical protein BD410DRAFT_781349 [Rickenella mellea]
MIARISVCDYRGNLIVDTFVRPTQAVVDYRSAVTGLQPHHLWTAPLFADVQKKVATVFRGRILVGHSLWQHLSLIGIRHPALDTRDLSLFLPFRRSLCGYSVVPLRQLVYHLMRRKIGFGYEHPLEEARAALDLFRSYEEHWEDIIRAGGWPCSLPPSAFIEWFQ